MKFIILENQIERILAFKYLRKVFENSTLSTNDDSKVLKDENNDVIVTYTPSSGLLKVLKSKLWSDVKKRTHVDVYDLQLILRALSIDTFGLNKKDVLKLEIVNYFSDENLELTENSLEKYIKNIVSKVILETEPIGPLLNPNPSPSFNIINVLNRNPLLNKMLPDKQNFSMLVKDLPIEKQVDKLADELNKSNPNLNVKKVGSNMLNLTVKNPLVDKKFQPSFPIKISGNVDLRLKPKPGLNSATLTLTVPF